MTRRVEVAPPRFAGWVSSFAERHGGGLTAEPGRETVGFGAADGALARCQVPFPPLECADAVPTDDTGPADLARRIAEHACADRTVGVLLVRRGGYAAGVFTGTGPSLAASKVGSRLVQGRSAAGGQSQRRFARRRENQARHALASAADTAVAVFAPYRLDALVLGGDRRALAVVSTDVRLVPYFERAVEAFLAVPDPRLAVLRDTPRLFRAIRIALTEPERAPAGGYTRTPRA
ncbi:MAG TPA: acVLRF1 family peptidyl-tRNA hydrolase [Streptosporangiaceae bacterium]|nr:acVLRF1 family peptidyl-tRNA hydrolase [Streptosporangiaceae bacterium]